MAKLIFLILVLVSNSSYSANSAPKWEVRTAPIAFIWAWATLDLSYFADENWAIGPSVIVYAGPKGNMFLPGFNGTALGGHAIWAESFSQDALYASTHFFSENYDNYPHAFSGHYEVTGSKINAVIGKRWVNSENVSTMFGIGYEIRNHESTKVPDSGPPVTEQKNFGFIHIEAKLGYSF